MEKKYLLVLDEDTDFCSFIQQMAENAGFEHTITTHLTDFLAAYHSYQPDLIILDLALQDSDGIKILQILQDLHCRCPIALMSKLNQEVMSCAHRLGSLYGLHMLQMTTKPVDQHLLCHLLRDTKKQQRFEREEIQNALKKHEFYMHYQPKIALDNQIIVGAEALVRWQRDKEVIYPDDFISIVEEHALTRELTLLTLNEVLEHYISINNQYENFLVSINLSGQLLADLTLADEFEKRVKHYNISPTNICFEIAEASVMRQPLIAIAMMSKLREKKFYLALDNFGTGFSSLPTLYRMPFHELKIDRSLITTLPNDYTLGGLTQGIINLGRSFGYKVTAEGVEQHDILKMLKDINCDFAQGYYICPPLAAEEFVKWLQQQHLQETAQSILG